MVIIGTGLSEYYFWGCEVIREVFWVDIQERIHMIAHIDPSIYLIVRKKIAVQMK